MTNSKAMRIGFIGAGNMASAIIRAITAKGIVASNDVMVINKSNRKRIETLKLECKVRAAVNFNELASLCDTLVICTEPGQVPQVLDSIGHSMNEGHLLISIAAGIPIQYIQSRLAGKAAVIRAMPNTPVQAGEGVIALAASQNVSKTKAMQAEKIFHPLGKAVWVPENYMDIITALSGSGPAYFYNLAAEMSRAAEKLGLDGKLARELSAQTLIGAGQLLKQTGADVESLLKQVVSPKGTTAAALDVFEAKRLNAVVEQAITKAAARACTIFPG